MTTNILLISANELQKILSQRILWSKVTAMIKLTYLKAQWQMWDILQVLSSVGD